MKCNAPDRNAAESPRPDMAAATSSAQSLSLVKTIACGNAADLFRSQADRHVHTQQQRALGRREVA